VWLCFSLLVWLLACLHGFRKGCLVPGPDPTFLVITEPDINPKPDPDASRVQYFLGFLIIGNDEFLTTFKNKTHIETQE
jgi:hypothetical protein